MVKDRILSVAHLSDLHVGGHSWHIWEALTRKLISLNPDLYVISGDISESNEEYSLQFVLSWLKGAISPFDTNKAFGLRLGENFSNKVIIIPGNHDYYTSNGSPFQLPKGDPKVNYYNVFKRHKLPRWHFCSNGKDVSAYIIALESPGEKSIANGYVEKNDLELVRKWTDQGRHGNLKKDGLFLGIDGLNSEEEAANLFNRSYKIIVLHHFLYLPKAYGKQPFMSLTNAHEVLGQIVSDDFDMVLAGHDHHDVFSSQKYQDLLDHRAIRRFARMYCVRQLGIKRPPVYHIDKNNNKLLPKTLRIAIEYVKSKAEGMDDVAATKFYRFKGITLAERSIKKGYKEFLKVDLSDSQVRKTLDEIAGVVNDEIRSVLKNRKLINSVAATATKKNSRENGFYIYQIDGSRNIQCHSYYYNIDSKEFENNGVESCSLSRPLDLFDTHAYEKLKKAKLIN
ncbi:metallophosphoesterase family protein [Flexistipes sp.]|uniref:metallophosphoesterase family protein n=1 Tax=Flexistipes sp. TaxID=3088135 RepID=UPI002E1C64BF|nr:metallophosphoesterase [Flexistipes sp.]